MHLNRTLYTIAVSAAALFTSHASAITPYVTPLLIIDDSNPSAVTITATDYGSFRNDTVHTFGDGIDLTNFFESLTDVPADTFYDFGVAPLSDLTTGVPAIPVYDSAETDDFTGTYADLNLYTDDTDTPEIFKKSPPSTLPAFTGTLTLDLSNEVGFLPAAGTIGAIYAGYEGDPDGGDLPPGNIDAFAFLNLDNYLQYIGDYEVIPEPSQWTLLLVGAAGLLAFQRFRSARRES